MSTVTVLENIRDILLVNVSPQIQLQQPNDNNVQAYELVNPNVFVGWIPPNGYLPDGLDSAIPCLIVGLDEASDDGREAQYDIRISAAVFSPGLHEPDGDSVKYAPDFQGYIDLLNLIDRAKAELLKNRIVSDLEWGMYQEQPYPYWYGWIKFALDKPSYPPSEIVKDYL